MNKVKITHKQKKTVYMAEMKIGQFGILQGGEFEGQIIVKAFSGWFSLNDPSNTWTDCSPLFEVEILEPLTIIEITIR